MTATWRTLNTRFDALAQRERVLVAIAVIVAAVFVFFTLAIDPLLLQQKRLTQQIVETRQNIKAAEILLAARDSRTDPDSVRRSYRDALRKQLAEIDSSMQDLQQRLVPPERMPGLLEAMLVGSRGLRLVALRTLPAQRFDSPGAAAPGQGKETRPATPESGRHIYQHGVELTLEGSYVSLHDYLARLERSPHSMFWGRLTLDARAHPRLRATLTVHTLSLSKAWLIV